jgi:hypothetical protein
MKIGELTKMLHRPDFLNDYRKLLISPEFEKLVSADF